MTNPVHESIAASIFRTAIREGRANELLEHLLDGGSCTVDAVTGRLILYPASMFKEPS